MTERHKSYFTPEEFRTEIGHELFEIDTRDGVRDIEPTREELLMRAVIGVAARYGSDVLIPLVTKMLLQDETPDPKRPPLIIVARPLHRP